MNRIVLIGNGFDLAHGLKTSYADFISDFWTDKVRELVTAGSLAVFNEDYDITILCSGKEKMVVPFQITNVLQKQDIRLNMSYFLHGRRMDLKLMNLMPY